MPDSRVRFFKGGKFKDYLIPQVEGRCFGIVPLDMMDGAKVRLDPNPSDQPYLDANGWERIGAMVKEDEATRKRLGVKE